MKNKTVLRVEKFVTSDLVTVERLAPVSEAMALMREHSISSLVVDRHDPDDEPGLITVSDIALKVIAENHAPERVNVYEIMSKPVLTVAADMQARYAVNLLVRFGISRAVVVDHHRNPVGIVTLRDLVLGHVAD